MEHFALLRMLHGVAGVLLFVAFFALAGRCWRSRRLVAGAPSRWPAFHAVLLLLCLVGLPVSGWWLAHLAGWPLGQLWLLGSSLLFLPGAICGLWLAARVAGRRAGARLGLGLALIGVSCFAAILGLMVIKPV
ncbi:DUF2269 family protein [Azotobacter salinestris]|uniref:DUF2269 family protein n=1 Tax=Azotobacter salinestris TaxID=69964 RepID=UPI0032DF0613